MKNEDAFSFKDFFLHFTTRKAIIFIIIIGAALYINTLFNGFVLDDNGQILTNRSIHSLPNIFDILQNKINAREVDNYFRPMLFVFYTLIASFFDIHAFYFHFTQVVFHILNSVLLFLIFKRFFRQGTAFLVAVLFLVHPINEEAVAYIANLQDVLFVFFGLLAFYLLQKDPFKTKYIIFANLSLLLSMLSKETGVLFFIVCYLYIFLYRKKILLLYSVSAAVSGGVYLLFRYLSHIPFREVPVVPIMKLSLLERMVNIPAIIFYYIQTFLYPKDLVAAHTWVIRSITFNSFFIPLFFDLLFFTALFLICYVSYKKEEKILGFFFLIWLVLGLLIHLQLIPLDMTVADRFFYFPIIGLLGILAIPLNTIKVSTYGKYYFIGISVVLACILMMRTAIRNTNWKDQTTIITHDERISKNDYLLELVLSTDLIERKKYKEALVHAKKAQSLYPQSWFAWGNIGIAYQHLNDIELAKQAYLRSISIYNDYQANENLALLLLRYDSLQNARNFIVNANKTQPSSAKLWSYRIFVEDKLHNKRDALYAAKQYFNLIPNNTSYTIYYRLQNNIPLNINMNYGD